MSNKTEWLNLFSNFKNVNIVFKYNDAHSMYELVDATLEAMKYFSHYEYQHFINLSGQDYPLKSVDTIKKILNKDISYIDYAKMPAYQEYAVNKNPEPPGGFFIRHEYKYYKVPLTTFQKRVIRKLRRKKYRLDRPVCIKIPRLDKN